MVFLSFFYPFLKHLIPPSHEYLASSPDLFESPLCCADGVFSNPQLCPVPGRHGSFVFSPTPRFVSFPILARWQGDEASPFRFFAARSSLLPTLPLLSPSCVPRPFSLSRCRSQCPLFFFSNSAATPANPSLKQFC